MLRQRSAALVTRARSKSLFSKALLSTNAAVNVKVHESDYVVLGAGSAGCVLAKRLTEDPDVHVALIEAGRGDTYRWDSWQIQMPSALTYSVAGTKNNWDYYTTPQTNLSNRKLHQPRGKVLGGSSSINAMVYARGHAEDFDRWASEEGAGEMWNYANILPYYKKAQKHAQGANEYRGGDGPLDVMSYSTAKVTNVLFNTLVDAGKEAGYIQSEDLNGKVQEGFGPFDMTVKPNGTRCSTAEAYLRPAQQTAGERLKVYTQTQASKILFEDDATAESGKKAVGVECVDLKTGEVVHYRARKEVISCLGSIGSPQLLMLSGIGDAKDLKSVGVKDIVYDNPKVGSNLQDHLEVYLQYLCTKPVTLYPIGNWTLKYLHRRLAVGIEWFLQGTGLGASNQFETGAFIRTKAGVKHPDIQYHFIPGCVVGQLEFLPHHGFQIHVGTVRPTSRGKLSLQSTDPMDAPLIDPNFLDTQDDKEDMRTAVKLADQIVRQPAFDEYRGERLAPVPEMDVNVSDEEVDTWIRNSSHSAYHPSCTCAIGQVVDGEGKVIGVSGLRVVDASIMPSMTSGNLNAPTIMMAEKLADCIRGRIALEPETQAAKDVYVMPEWETKQRQVEPQRA